SELAVQGVDEAEELVHRRIIFPLVPRRSHRVDAGGQALRDARVQSLHRRLEVRRTEVDTIVTAEPMERVIEHVGDLQRLVTDNSARTLVPKDRDRDFSGVVWRRG